MGDGGPGARGPLTRMARVSIDVFDSRRASVGESPLWQARDDTLLWVDVGARLIARKRAGDPHATTWTMPEQTAFIALRDDGSLVGGMESGLFVVDLSARTPQFAPLAHIDHPLANMRCNDGRCDRQGRLWFGTMHNDMPAAHAVGRLLRFADGVLSAPFVDDLVVQNGLAFSPDGTTMYLSDSHAMRRLVWAFDYDPATGTPSRRRVFADLHQHVGRPDGAAIDCDGAYWTCANDGAALLRFTPAGVLDRRIDLPVQKPSMCAFGGPALDTLFVTSIRPPNAAPAALDGCVLAVAAGVQGCAEPHFKDAQRALQPADAA
jgi:sugar lactone lactonase YvrE